MPQSTTQLEYQKRIQKALTFIREHLEEPVTLKDVAKAASMSEYHFHRIFSAVMGESLGEYVTRKRLERAAIQLAYAPSTTVSSLAFACGYSSVAAFSKAFNNWFGCRPTELSKLKGVVAERYGKLQSKYGMSIDPADLFVAPEMTAEPEAFPAIDRRVTVFDATAFSLVYLTSPGGYDFASIRETWRQLLERLADHGVDLTACDRFAISHDHPGLTPPERCRYDACVRLGSAPSNLALPSATVPAGRYAVYPVEGSPETILDQYLEFYTVWMPQSGYEPDHYPVLERYVPPYSERHLRVELWAKIKRI